MPQTWSSSELVTGEAVALDLGLAALPSRAVAAAIDLVAQVALLLVLGLLASLGTSDGAADAVAATLTIVVLVVVLIGYPVGFETLLRGRTPGKAAMGLRVVRDDGGPIGFRQALARGLAGAFLEKFGVSFYSLAVIVSLGNRRNKRVGDLLAGTVVVQERVSAPPAAVAMMPPPLAAWASTLELSGLTDSLALSVRTFVARAPQLTPRAREDLGGRLVTAVRQVTAPPPPPGTPGWAYLAAVLAERRRRETDRLSARPPYGAGPGYGGAPGTGPGYGAPSPYAAEPAPPPRADGAGFAPPG